MSRDTRELCPELRHLRARPLEVISGILFALFREDVFQPA